MKTRRKKVNNSAILLDCSALLVYERHAWKSELGVAGVISRL